jgi:hypothetical protein
VWAGCGLWVVLNREGRDVKAFKALNAVVIERYVAHCDAAESGWALNLWSPINLDGETMVVSGYLDATGLAV